MKNVVLIISLLIFINSSFSQSNKSGLNLSLKSGVTFANMYGPDVESETFLNGSNPENFYSNHPASNKFKNGLNIGLLLDYRIGKFLSFGFAINYIQKGAQINVTEYWNSNLLIWEDVCGNISWNQNFWTFEIPITFYIPVNDNDLYLQVGIYKGILINSIEKGNISISGQEYKYAHDRRANEKEPGFSLGCGYIYSLPNNKGKLFTELSYSISIINSPGSEMIPNPQFYHNQNININIGYKYYINHKKL